jgi:enamine deaminase RidA (YjgF/YER057c/UK114 family)
MAIKTVVTESGKFAYDNFHFAQAVESNGLLLCSGVIGTGSDRKVPDDIKEEFRNAWQAISKVLAEAGLGLGDIVEYTTYHVGLQSHIADFMAVRDEFLSEPWPSWTAIGITELAAPGAHVEIRVTAQK